MTATASPPGTALLAGATGDLGGLILRDLVGLGATVRVLTRPGTNTARIAQLRSQGAEVVRTRYDDPDGPPESLRKCGLRGLRYQRSRPRNRRRSSHWRRRRRACRDSSRPISLSVTVVSGPGATGTYSSVETSRRGWTQQKSGRRRSLTAPSPTCSPGRHL